MNDETYKFTLTIVLPAWCDKETARVAITNFVRTIFTGVAFESES